MGMLRGGSPAPAFASPMHEKNTDFCDLLLVTG